MGKGEINLAQPVAVIFYEKTASHKNAKARLRHRQGTGLTNSVWISFFEEEEGNEEKL